MRLVYLLVLPALAAAALVLIVESVVAEHVFHRKPAWRRHHHFGFTS